MRDVIRVTAAPIVQNHVELNVNSFHLNWEIGASGGSSRTEGIPFRRIDGRGRFSRLSLSTGTLQNRHHPVVSGQRCDVKRRPVVKVDRGEIGALRNEIFDECVSLVGDGVEDSRAAAPVFSFEVSAGCKEHLRHFDLAFSPRPDQPGESVLVSRIRGLPGTNKFANNVRFASAAGTNEEVLGFHRHNESIARRPGGGRIPPHYYKGSAGRRVPQVRIFGPGIPPG